MQIKKYDIFLSYRRLDSEGRISGRDVARILQKEFTLYGYEVFFDYSEIKDNEFENTIIPAIHNSKVYILVLTKDTLLRCSNLGDWVRREMREAIKSNIKLLRLNVDRAFKEWPKNFPQELEAIKYAPIYDISMCSLFEKSVAKVINILPKPSKIFNYGTKQISEDEFEKIRKKAFEGNDNAQNFLGNCYYNGVAAEKNYREAVIWYKKSADQGNSFAQCQLGKCFEKGLGVKQDYGKAVEWYNIASLNNNINAQYLLGCLYEQGKGVKKNINMAVKWYTISAEQGSLDAQTSLGRCYLHGYGVEKDFFRAIEWFAQAAKSGNAEGQCNLAECYFYGIGIEKNILKAIEWATKASDQGYTQAQINLGEYLINREGWKSIELFRKAAKKNEKQGQYLLGYCYYHGINISIDYSNAIEWFRMSAEQGHSGAQYYLGLCYKNGQGVEKNPNTAFLWFEKAASQNFEDAQQELGLCYYNGEGVNKNYKKAFRWFLSAYKNGNEEAQFHLGICYSKGEGVSKDPNESIRLLRKHADKGNCEAQYYLAQSLYEVGSYQQFLSLIKKAADNGLAIAQFHLGLIYEKNEEDKNEALKYYTKAAEQSCTEALVALGTYYSRMHKYGLAANYFLKASSQNSMYAQCNLGLLYLYGYGVDKDPKKAFNYFKKAEEQGLISAQIQLGLCYHFGKGVEKDLVKAALCFLRAAEKNDYEAQTLLADCYYYGYGIEKDYSEAAEWYLKAAKQGYARAQNAISMCYKKGTGVRKDLLESDMWQKKADGNYLDINYKCLENKILNGEVSKEITEGLRVYLNDILNLSPNHLNKRHYFQVIEAYLEKNSKGLDSDIVSSIRLLVDKERVIRNYGYLSLLRKHLLVLYPEYNKDKAYDDILNDRRTIDSDICLVLCTANNLSEVYTYLQESLLSQLYEPIRKDKQLIQTLNKLVRESESEIIQAHVNFTASYASICKDYDLQEKDIYSLDNIDPSELIPYVSVTLLETLRKQAFKCLLSIKGIEPMIENDFLKHLDNDYELLNICETIKDEHLQLLLISFAELNFDIDAVEKSHLALLEAFKRGESKALVNCLNEYVSMVSGQGFKHELPIFTIDNLPKIIL